MHYNMTKCGIFILRSRNLFGLWPQKNIIEVQMVTLKLKDLSDKDHLWKLKVFFFHFVTKLSWNSKPWNSLFQLQLNILVSCYINANIVVKNLKDSNLRRSMNLLFISGKNSPAIFVRNNLLTQLPLENIWEESTIQIKSN